MGDLWSMEQEDKNLHAQQPDEAQTPAKQPEPKGYEAYLSLFDLVRMLAVITLMFVFFFRVNGVSGSSMYPTLEDGDKILVSNLFYKPKQGDIVVFRKDEYREEPLVKRIIAVEGQTVDIDFNLGIVYVDGEALDEPYIAEATANPEDFIGPVKVDEGCVFVMGDNRNASTDSRTSDIGMVDERCIMGKVYFTVFPLKNFGSDYSG